MPTYVQGDMRLAPEGAVDGWCWCPARPRVRLDVDVLLDGRAVARTVADLPRDDLRARGVGDGRYGYRAALPRGVLAGARFVAVRAEGRVFGQVRRDAAEPEAPELSTEVLADRLGALLRQTRERVSPEAAMRRAAGDLACVLRVRAAGGGAIAAARALLAARCAGLAVPRPAAPRVTFVLAPPGLDAALRALRAVAEAAAGLPGEVCLLDDGADARLALLPSLLPSVWLAPVAVAGEAAALAVAARHARGAWLAMPVGEGTVSGVALADLLDRLGADGVRVARAGDAGSPRDYATLAGVGRPLIVRRDALPGAPSSEAVIVEPWAPPR